MFRALFLFFRQLNWLLIAPALLLVIYGLIVSFSLGAVKLPVDFSLFWKQVIFSIVGVLLLFLFSVIDYRYYRSWGSAIYIFAVAVSIGVLLFGTTIRATKGWFVIFGMTIQVVEFVKVMFIIALSAYFSRLKSSLVRFRDLFISALGIGALVFLTFLQRDMGSGLLLLCIYLGMLFLVRTRKSHMILLAAVLIAASIFSWFFILQPFQKERILTFLHPSRDPLGIGYNVKQSTIAIGSGQWFGRGLTLGSQSRLDFLPERQNDFIFAVIGEALGFAGILVLFSLFIALYYQMLRIARRSRDDFGILLAGGIAIALMLQTAVNISTNIGLLPIAGLPLPFLSAGGSSLMVSFLSVGIVASIDLRQRVGMAK